MYFTELTVVKTLTTMELLFLLHCFCFNKELPSHMYIVAISVQATPVDDNSKYSSIYPTFAVHSAVKEIYDGNHLAHSITMIQFLAFESYFDLRNKNHYLFCVGINWHELHKFFDFTSFCMDLGGWRAYN